ncbi:hypothetical protein Tco_0951685 [Tanacetum coccineum]|uniref:Uncharacterized protein n=1 Tax=Tanacetum coccineum TaxID=301880 RepID=A0ABQ5DV77_9ASTR
MRNNFATAEIDQAKNNEALGINLDLKKKEGAKQQYKSNEQEKDGETLQHRVQRNKVQGRVIWLTAARKASHANTKANLDPKWAGPNEVKRVARKPRRHSMNVMKEQRIKEAPPATSFTSALIDRTESCTRHV